MKMNRKWIKARAPLVGEQVRSAGVNKNPGVRTSSRRFVALAQLGRRDETARVAT